MHEKDALQLLFERGAHSVGLDFLAHPFWDKYLEFEERIDGHAQIFAILSRIIHIPMHQYARYFERFRSLASRRALTELVPEDILAQFRADLNAEAGAGRSEYETERALRGKIDQYHLDVFTRTQTETTKRWTYEQEIKRPYFHVTDLDDAQLANWRKYLDFEEAEDDVARAAFLYERCLVSCAYYDEFWLRFARWMSRVAGKQQEVRNIYERAACLFAPIARPQVRIHYALFEEQQARVDVARDIHAAVLAAMPGHVDTVVSLANLERRHGGVDAALAVYTRHVDVGADGKACGAAARGAFVAESARLLWLGKGHVDEARALLQKSTAEYADVPRFWETWLMLELRHATFPEGKAGPTAAHEQEQRVKALWGDIMQSRLSLETVQELARAYMAFLMERGGDTAAKEYLDLDRELFGPTSVQRKATAPADAKKGDMPPNGLLIR